jgi:uncharacterized membrane protein
MEETFMRMAGVIALAIEGAAVVLIAIGALEGFVRALWRMLAGTSRAMRKKQIWVRFAAWLMLGLELELGADVVRTAISPTWNGIGQLGAIATIRTALNYFLERDIAEFGEEAELHP